MEIDIDLKKVKVRKDKRCTLLNLCLFTSVFLKIRIYVSETRGCKNNAVSSQESV